MLLKMRIFCPRCWARFKAFRHVAFFAPDSVASFETKEGEVAVSLASGATLSARLLAAADGRKSKLAEMAGIQTTVWPSKKVGIVATVGIEHPHNGTAWSISFRPALCHFADDRQPGIRSSGPSTPMPRTEYLRKTARPSWRSCRAASATSWAS